MPVSASTTTARPEATDGTSPRFVGASRGEDAPLPLVFLTGASGVVGQVLLRKLPPERVVCLTHRSPVTAAEGARQLQGDILQARLGLSQSDYRELARSAGCIVHCAAVTSFARDDETIFQANVEGTRNVLDLASDAGVPLYHLSTSFVLPMIRPELDWPANAYARSKAAAERLVLESGVPNVILRPSRIIGDSRTGSIARFQGFHFIFDLLLRGEAPVIAAPPHAYADFVPQDLVVNVLDAMIRRRRVGGEFWLTAGRRALSVERMYQLSVEHLARLTGRELAQPRFVDLDEFEREIRPRLLHETGPELLALLDGVLQMMYSLNPEPFPDSMSELGAEFGLAPMPDPETTLLRNLQYWARRRGLVKAVLSP